MEASGDQCVQGKWWQDGLPRKVHKLMRTAPDGVSVCGVFYELSLAGLVKGDLECDQRAGLVPADTRYHIETVDRVPTVKAGDGVSSGNPQPRVITPSIPLPDAQPAGSLHAGKARNLSDEERHQLTAGKWKLPLRSRLRLILRSRWTWRACWILGMVGVIALLWPGNQQAPPAELPLLALFTILLVGGVVGDNITTDAHRAQKTLLDSALLRAERDAACRERDAANQRLSAVKHQVTELERVATRNQ